MVDQLRLPQWFGAGPGGPGPAAEPAAPAPGGGLVRAPLHGLQRLHAGAVGAADRPVHPPDRLHDHRRQHARPGLSDVGIDAARTRLRHALVRQVAPDPRRQQVDARSGGSRGSSATASPAAPTPRPTARPARAGAWTRASPASSSSGSRRVGEAEPWCTTVSFVNPHDIAWWYDWSDRVPAEATRAERGRGAAAQLRDAGTADRAGQAAPAALAAGNRRRLVRAGAVHGPGSREHAGWGSSTSTSSCSSRSTGTSAACWTRWRAARGSRRTR